MTATKGAKSRDADAEARAWDRLGENARDRLVARTKEHGAPPLPYQPGFDNAFVYRFPNPKRDRLSAGGIHLPDVNNAEDEWLKDRFKVEQDEEEPHSHGLLMQAGLEARDAFRTHGFLIGDIVFFGRFAGWEKAFEDDRKGEGKKQLLQLKERDILGSADLHGRLYGKKPTMRIVYKKFDDAGLHVIEPIY